MARRLGKRKQNRREVYMLNEQNKVESGVFDTKTMVWLRKFFSKDIVANLGYIIARGKEADVYIADAGQAKAVHSQAHVVLKFFRIETSSFLKMADYINGDPRFSGISGKKYGIIMEWCKKEFGNLQIAERAEVHAPKPIMFNGSILAMSFIGEDSVPSMRLKECKLQSPRETLGSILDDVKKLYSKRLVHGDLSEYNILMRGRVPYLIDFGQAVLLQHPKSQEFLVRDVHNILQYFARVYGIEEDPEKVLKRITG